MKSSSPRPKVLLLISAAFFLGLASQSEAAAELSAYIGSASNAPLSELDMGYVVVGKPAPQTIILKNTGTVPLTNLSVAGPSPAFVFTFTQPAVRKLAVGASTTMTVTVKASIEGAFSSNLQFGATEAAALFGLPLIAHSTLTGTPPTNAVIALDGTPLGGALVYDASGSTPLPAELLFVVQNPNVSADDPSPSAPLSYVWTKDGKAIPGASGSTLLLKPFSAAKAGRYSVTQTNPYGHTTSAPVDVVILNRPTIATVTVNQDASATFTVTGVSGPATYLWANDAMPVTNYPDHGNTFTLPSVNPDDAGTITATILGGDQPNPLYAGTFTLVVRPKPVLNLDVTLFPAPPDSLSITVGIYVESSITVSGNPASVTATGLPPGLAVVKAVINDDFGGKVVDWQVRGHPTTPGFYRTVFRAANAAGQAIPLVQNFTIIPLPAEATGTFIGLAEVAAQTAGYGGKITINVTPAGTFTLKMFRRRDTLSATGIFDYWVDSSIRQELSTTVLIGKYRDAGTVTMDLTLNVATGTITGVLQATNFTDTSAIAAARVPWDAAHPAPKAMVGRYTAALSRMDEDIFELPATGGQASYVVGTNGAATFAARLADGTVTTQGGLTDFTGSLPIHTILYQGTWGYLQGTVTPGNPSSTSTFWDGSLTGSLSWHRGVSPKYAPGTNPLIYPDGFSVDLNVEGGKYLPTPKDTVPLGLPEVSQNALLAFSGEGVVPGDSGDTFFTFTRSGGVLMATGEQNPGGAKLSVNLATGAFSGSVTMKTADEEHPGKFFVRPVSFTGLLRSRTNDGVGSFLLHLLPDSTATPPQTLANTEIVAGEVTISANVNVP